MVRLRTGQVTVAEISSMSPAASARGTASNRTRTSPRAIGADTQLGSHVAEEGERVRTVDEIPGVMRMRVRHVPPVRDDESEPGIVAGHAATFFEINV
jgi:hypothetical protein